MYLDAPQPAIRQPDRRNTLAFPPSASAVYFPKKRTNLDASAARDRLDFFDFADDLEQHNRIVVENLRFGKSSQRQN